MNIRGGGVTDIDQDPGLFGGTITEDCPAKLSGLVSLQTPPTLPLPLNSPVTYKIQAVGCTGKYTLAEAASQVFTSSTTVQRTYTSPGEKSESFVLNSVDNTGRVVASITKLAIVQVQGNVTPPPVPPTPPTCQVMRLTPVLGPNAPMTFALQLGGGTAVQAQLSDGIALTANALNGGILTVPPNADGIYRVFGYVGGPGGSNFCQIQFVPPKCTLALEQPGSNSVLAKVTVPAGVTTVHVQDQPVDSGDPSLGRTITTNVTFGTAGGLKTVEAKIWGPQFPFGRDHATCNAQITLQRPCRVPPTVVVVHSDGQSRSSGTYSMDSQVALPADATNITATATNVGVDDYSPWIKLNGQEIYRRDEGSQGAHNIAVNFAVPLKPGLNAFWGQLKNRNHPSPYSLVMNMNGSYYTAEACTWGPP